MFKACLSITYSSFTISRMCTGENEQPCQSHQVSATQGRLVSRFVSFKCGEQWVLEKERAGVGVKAGHSPYSWLSLICFNYTPVKQVIPGIDFIILTLQFFLLLLPKHTPLPFSPKYVYINRMYKSYKVSQTLHLEPLASTQKRKHDDNSQEGQSSGLR